MRRKVVLFLVVGLVLPLVVAASASAQGSSLILSPKTASRGEVVTATSFGGYTPGAGISDVTIRLSTRSGRVLRTTQGDPRGNINTSFPVPADLTPGTYLVLATQTISNGRQRGFTPGRAKLVVRAAAASNQGGLPFPSSPLALSGMILTLFLLVAAGSRLIARRLRMPHQPLGKVNS